MSWILVIESEAAALAEISEAVAQAEPPIAVVPLRDSHAFLAWMTKFIAQDAALIASLPKGKFLGLVTSVESWRFRDVKLIGKFKKLFVQKGLATEEEELGVVFTGYEAPLLQTKRFENRAVNNLIFKPFDKTLLWQMLSIAFTGRHPVKKYFVHNMKMDAKIEMLKEIVSDGVSEMGFHTVSDQNIDIGRISKYYASFLETDQHRSALAQALRVENTGTLPWAPYAVELRFFALDQQQSFNLQKLVRQSSQPRALPSATAAEFEFLFVKHKGTALCEEIEPSFTRFFDHPMKFVEDGVALKKELTTPFGGRRFVFIDQAQIQGNEAAEIQSVLAGVTNISVFLLSAKILPEALELELSALCEDIYYRPFNKSYLIKGLKQRWPALKTKEELVEARREFEQTMHASNPVQIVEVSEAGIVIEYYRELGLGSFREFVFWMPDETSTPTLLAQCNANVPVKGKETFHVHFVFFGLRDHELKFIRLWTRLQYVEAKQKAGG